MKILDNLTKESIEENSSILNLSNGEYIYYDFSKSHITSEDKNEIKNKILNGDLNLKIEGMWNGENINFTESRPVLHYLLRDKSVLEMSNKYKTDSNNSIIENAKKEIVEELIKVSKFTDSFNTMKGITDQSFDTIVNIGIGGSDLGPRFVTDALQYYSMDRKVFFISNVDPSDSIKVFKKINPEKTLFIVVSKTFTTIETMENFKLVLKLIKNSFGNKFTEEEICNSHFVAVSSNIPETSKYGIKTVFKMWDFVGGRYSLWSAVGLSISLYIGFENYIRLLRGASEADEEFYKNKINSISAKMAINELFYIEKGYNNKCIVCYDSYLELMYKYLQQAEMESNGKHGSKQMIIWGGVGTDVQHSFFQLLHQGEQQVYLEFLCPVKNITSFDGVNDDVEYHHKLLIASCLAQSRSMLIGKKTDDVNHYFEGDKPSVTILYSKLTPETLGAILSIYENKTFVEGVFFNINSFDQFGVELGKALTKELMKKIEDEKNDSLDCSTEKLLTFINK